MNGPALYAQAYANLWSWVTDNGDAEYTASPIIQYLQSGKGAQSANAQAAEKDFRSKLGVAAMKENPQINLQPTFKFNGYDYINNSIKRTFMGKACPWEIQETLQLGSQIGALSSNNLLSYCNKNLGVDCGGFVANFWGEAVPHLGATSPWGFDGIKPRTFWAGGGKDHWSDALLRRRTAFDEIRIGDAAIFFKGVIDNNPDKAAKSDGKDGFVEGSGSQAFHIGLVNDCRADKSAINFLEIAESSGAHSQYGGSGVNVRTVDVSGSGTSGRYVYAENGKDERIYFVKPPEGAGPELPWNFGEQ